MKTLKNVAFTKNANFKAGKDCYSSKSVILPWRFLLHRLGQDIKQGLKGLSETSGS